MVCWPSATLETSKPGHESPAVAAQPLSAAAVRHSADCSDCGGWCNGSTNGHGLLRFWQYWRITSGVVQ